MKLTTISLALLSIPLVACSHDPLEPGQGSDPGAGTGTLFVEGNASAEPHLPSAKLPGDFSTDFSVRLQLNGAPVTAGAMVTVQSLNVNVVLTYNPDNGGRWEGTAAGYDESYRLDVVSGADKVTGVIVDGPDIHTMAAPMQGASLDSTMPIDVLWDRGEAADVATLDVGHIDRLTIADNGKYTLPPSSLDAEKDKTKENQIEIRRSNRVTPAGAIGGSSFSVSIRNNVDVLALANPNLP
jgi:hypothetical protein